MSLQRVSSRPRLVSDTDMDFVNANTIVEQEEDLSLHDGYDYDGTTNCYEEKEEKERNEKSGLCDGLFYDKSSRLVFLSIDIWQLRQRR